MKVFLFPTNYLNPRIYEVVSIIVEHNSVPIWIDLIDHFVI